MPDYQVVLARSAERDLRNLPSQIQDRVMAVIGRLANNPRPRGVKKLRGGHHLWRLRVGDYRVIYEIQDQRHVVDVSHVRHRREAYE
ncbi:MAG: type II toxin-antitoxin system RelE family toxin [Thermoanaerobaculia bacterium]